MNDSQLIWEAYRRRFEDSANDVEDLVRKVHAMLQTPEKNHEHTWDAIQDAIRDGAMEGVDIIDFGWMIRDVEEKKYINSDDADAIIDIVNTVDQELDQIDRDFSD